MLVYLNNNTFLWHILFLNSCPITSGRQFQFFFHEGSKEYNIPSLKKALAIKNGFAVFNALCKCPDRYHSFKSLYVLVFILTYDKVFLMSTFMIFTIFRCECPFGFDGPRCQQVRHSFSGNGWAEYKTLPQCGNGSTIIEVLTTQSNGLVMYNGPRKNPGKKMY